MNRSRSERYGNRNGKRQENAHVVRHRRHFTLPFSSSQGGAAPSETVDNARVAAAANAVL
jgi:hypothetical protein